MSTPAEAARRTVRIMRFSFLVYGALLIVVVFRVPAKAQHPANSSMEMAITLIALVEVVLGFLAPRLFSRLPLNPAVSRRASTPGKQWIVRCVTSMSMFLSCILFALVLHFVGARAYFVELLIAVGMLSLILWRPGTPPGSEDGVITHY